MAAVAVPVWLALLLVVPLTGLGVIASLTVATLAAGAAGVGVEMRRGIPSGPRRPQPARRMSPAGAAALTLAGVAVLAYLILVISST